MATTTDANAYSDEAFAAAVSSTRALLISYWKIAKVMRETNKVVDLALFKDFENALYAIPLSVRAEAVQSFTNAELRTYGQI